MNTNFYQTLQKAKESIGFYADGSGTPEANLAKELWYTLDQAQIGIAVEVKP